MTKTRLKAMHEQQVCPIFIQFSTTCVVFPIFPALFPLQTDKKYRFEKLFRRFVNYVPFVHQNKKPFPLLAVSHKSDSH